MVFLGNRLLWSRRTGDVPFTVSGGPKLTPSKFGLVQGFGATYGSGTTDRLDGGVLPRPASGWRSIVSHYYANSTGGGGLGRIFQDASGTGLQAGEALYISASNIQYGLYGTTSFGAWQTPALTTGRWQSAGITHDQRTVNVVPVMYLDGGTVSVSTITNASGTYQTTPCNLVWGNRASDGARNWDGLLGPTLIFDGALTAAEHAILDKNPWSVIDTDDWMIFAPAAAGGTTITCTVGNASAAGTAALVNASIAATVGNATAAGVTSNVNATIQTSTGNATASGVAANLNATIQTTTGNATAAGVTAAITSGGGTTITCSVGNATAAGTNAFVNATIQTVTGNAIAAGPNAIIFAGGLLTSDPRYTVKHMALNQRIAAPKRNFTTYAH